MNEIKVKCNRCLHLINQDTLIESIQRAANGVIHIRGECPLCRMWIKFVPYRDSKIIKNLLIAVVNGDIEKLISQKDLIYDEKERDII